MRWLLPALGVVIVFVLLGGAIFGLSGRLGAAPEQPVAFPHDVHVKGVGLDCTFCHRTATTGDAAGIPSVEQCMFCHRVVGQGNPEIEKVRQAGQNQSPIDWIKVHRLPDSVHFTHAPHIRAGVACATCHGQVEGMKQARQVRDLRMGDCVSCHRQNNATTDCAACHY
ncbi:MAG: cytochrome c3 family protein [Chloroflexi bacterium]|nr:cytochrome c3 family protein [Chloroflexota bacterium]